MKDLSKHRILLVNDDGIDAPGMQVLERVARRISNDVWVVAPKENFSGASHSLSIGSQMRIYPQGDQRFAVQATPAECTMLAIHDLMVSTPPTVCLSGINRGPNLAEDTVYSGTIAAAREATQLSVPAIALSQVFAPGEKDFTIGEDRPIHWETSERWCEPVLRQLLAQPLRPDVFLNVNFPGVKPNDVAGLRVTTVGQRPPGCYVPEPLLDEAGERYYRMKLAYREGNPHPDSDLQAIADHHISVTPLKLDLTCEAHWHQLRSSTTSPQ